VKHTCTILHCNWLNEINICIWSNKSGSTANRW